MKLSIRRNPIGVISSAEGREYIRYLLAEFCCRLIYPKYRFSEFGRLFLEDQEFSSLYRRATQSSNFHGLDRYYTLDQLMQLTLTVPGDTAECGAFRGGSSYIICRRNCETAKFHHVFDSFVGLSRPLAEDGTHWQAGDLSASEKVVQEALREFEGRFHLYKGWIPDRFDEVSTRRFSFIHIDVDLKQPTIDSINFFYPRLSDRGILLFDDYGFRTCPGCKSAVDLFFANREPIIQLPSGQAYVQRDCNRFT